jgi:hypothetical protein
MTCFFSVIRIYSITYHNELYCNTASGITYRCHEEKQRNLQCEQKVGKRRILMTSLICARFANHYFHGLGSLCTTM